MTLRFGKRETGLRGWRLALFGLACGVGASTSLPLAAFAWAAPLAVAALYLGWRACVSPRRAFALRWWAGVGYFGASLWWIAEAFFVDAATFGWMAPFAVTFMAGGLALFWAAGFLLARLFPRDGVGGALAFAALWSAMEYARGHVLTGFPWGMLGYAWVDTPVMQTASLVGIYGVTLGTLTAGAALGSMLSPGRSAFGRIAMLALCGGLIGGAWLWGDARMQTPLPTGPKTQIGVVQPNIAQKDKWRPELRRQHLGVLLDQTAALRKDGADVIIWPEAAAPYFLAADETVRALIAQALDGGGTVIAGTQRAEGEPNAQLWRNSAVAINADGDIVGSFDKRHLVPFGEYVPLYDLLGKIGIRKLVNTPGGFTPGAGLRLMAPPGVPSFAPMICYEAIFPQEIVDRDGARPEWLLQITNDAWFGRSAGPWQHLAQAQVRAIEQGLPLMRSANTGVSAAIDAYGRVEAALPLDERGTLKRTLGGAAPITAYAQFGDPLSFIGWGLLLLSAVVCAAIGKGLRQKRR